MAKDGEHEESDEESKESRFHGDPLADNIPQELTFLKKNCREAAEEDGWDDSNW